MEGAVIVRRGADQFQAALVCLVGGPFALAAAVPLLAHVGCASGLQIMAVAALHAVPHVGRAAARPTCSNAVGPAGRIAAAVPRPRLPARALLAPCVLHTRDQRAAVVPVFGARSGSIPQANGRTVLVTAVLVHDEEPEEDEKQTSSLAPSSVQADLCGRL